MQVNSLFAQSYNYHHILSTGRHFFSCKSSGGVCLVFLHHLPFLSEHWDSEDDMQHAGGAGGGAWVPERRAAGEGEAVGGLERRPGGREKPSGATHQGPAATAGQREAEQVRSRSKGRDATCGKFLCARFQFRALWELFAVLLLQAACRPAQQWVSPGSGAGSQRAQSWDPGLTTSSEGAETKSRESVWHCESQATTCPVVVCL